MLGLGAGSTLVPPTQGGREDLCFPTSPVELGAQAGTAKLLSPCTQGPACTGGNPPGVHLTAEPCNGRLAAWAAGGNGREFRSPLEQGSAGRGRVPSRLMSPKPKSMACWQHGLPAGTATTVVVRFSDALRNSRCVGADVHTHEGHTLAGPRPRASQPARSLPSWRCLRICYETQGV